MLTKNEITSLNLSPTKKDFVQIWNELLEVAGKLSERWDPTSTNESDPGIVILKALTGIADKLNYNIDKNTLEAFMPTAAQEDSMRKLCDMLGYNIKYYQSAQTTVTVKYYNADPSDDEVNLMVKGIYIPKFTVVTNSDSDISYFTINEEARYISAEEPTKQLICMEGQLVKCSGINNNVITANQISENNRFYLPETQIAENGIFIYNIFSSGLADSPLEDGTAWKKVDNLNIQTRGSRVYKFGFDSYLERPYVEFPEDYSELFKDGLFIYYTRTRGLSGNISAGELTQIELPKTGDWDKISADSFSVTNSFAATTGSNIETIKQAYNNFKKTIGTFETLVTCRDYMNKIYLMVDEQNNKPYVSNALVTDIRNDLNRAITICSCDEAGIFYKESSLTSNIPVSEATKPVFDKDSLKWHLGSLKGMEIAPTKFIENAKNYADIRQFNMEQSGEILVEDGYWVITQKDSDTNILKFKTNLLVGDTKPEIEHFDIVLYPFKFYNQLSSNIKDVRRSYDASFSYDPTHFETIKDELESNNIKTIAHNIKKPRVGDLISINNYLRLSATIATNNKITNEEGTLIIENIKIALANAFNMRELDFGEEIPFESIVEVMEKADARIKVVSLNEPSLYTTFTRLKEYDEYNVPQLVEYAVKSDPWLVPEAAYATGRLGTARKGTYDINEAKEIYNNLALRNVLAGRLPLFNYNNTFSTNFYESTYLETTQVELTASEILGLGLPIPSSDIPYVVYTHSDGTIYTGIWEKDEENPGNAEGNITYYKTSVPDNLASVLEDNLITNVQDEYITEIQTDCNIKTDSIDDEHPDSNSITNVTLADNEYVKFRAPNFTTLKTYPAYVNYHLALNKTFLADPESAKASTLFDLLDKDRDEWSLKNTDIGWQKVLDHFSTYKKDSVKTFTLTQGVSAYSEKAESIKDLCNSSDNKTQQHVIGSDGKTCKYCGKPVISDELKSGPILITLDGDSYETGSENMSELFSKSGCAKFTNNVVYNSDKQQYAVEAELKWDTSDGTTKPSGDGPSLPLQVLVGTSPFVTDFNVFTAIQTAINEELEVLRGQHTKDGKPALPTDCAWTISFTFECVPFEPATLYEWERFVRLNPIKKFFGFEPVEETGTVLWRVHGEGYRTGKYILDNSEKLLKFDSSYFGVLPVTRLKGVYLVEYMGKDSIAAIISNNSEYSLKADEYLYLEYTPSTTLEDGTSQESDVVKEVYGPGTIVKPSGFSEGFMDSAYYASRGKTYFKTVTFDNPTGSGSVTLGMHRFSANEQIEIRDLAKVELTKDSFKSSPAIYIYKNFNNCDVLEKSSFSTESGQRVYTLKDGEYIFYTDQNQSELAYFTDGTQVAIEGDLEIPTFDTVDIADILNSGIQEIPWTRLNFKNNDSLTFQEFQYVTLGPGDTLDKVVLTKQTDVLGKEWLNCDSVKYTLAGSKESLTLDPISTYDAKIETTKGNGWEASSILELDVAADKAQTLRKTDQVETSLTLISTSASGGGEVGTKTIVPSIEKPLSVKSNISCYASSSRLNIKDVYSNPKNLPGFTLKVFSSDAPAIVKTSPGRVVPCYSAGTTDIVSWEPEETFTNKDYSELWTSLDLSKLTSSDLAYDKALRLPINLLPNTYGVFCIYLNYYGEQDTKTWIEVLPGMSSADITLLNTTNDDYYIKAEEATNDSEKEKINKPDKLFLNPGINCIRVNKSGKIFVKTSSSAEGALYFNDFRLVNCQKLEYTLKNEYGEDELVSATTQGLNLQQLGYLLISDVDASTLDLTNDEVFTSVKTTYLDQTYEYLEEESAKASKDFSVCYNEVSEIVNKIQTLVAIEDAIAKDLEYLCNTSNVTQEELAGLTETYKNVNDMLNKEQTLLRALTANKNIEASEQLLIQLLNSLSTTEVVQQQLRQELDLLITATQDAITTLQADIILTDFSEGLDSEEQKTAFIEIKKVAKEKLDEDFNSQLEVLADSLEQITGSDARNRLLTLLTDLHIDRTSEGRARLTTLINQLKAAVEQADLENLLISMDTAAIEGAYTQLATLLLQLSNMLDTSDLSSLVSELEQAAIDNSHERALTLVEDLKNYINSSVSNDKEQPSTAALITEIDLLRTKAIEYNKPLGGTLTEEEIAATELQRAQEVISAVGTLCGNIKSFYQDTREELLDSIEELLKELSGKSGTTGALTTEDLLLQNIKILSESLDEGKVEQLETHIGQITDLIDIYSDNTTLLEVVEVSDAWDENISEFIQAAIVDIWPTYMRDRVSNFITQINNTFDEAFSLEIDSIDVLTDFDAIIDCLTNTQRNLINTEAFEGFFKELSSVLNAFSQNRSNIAIIKTISSNISLPASVSTAMQNLQSVKNSTKNSVLARIINDILLTDSEDIVKRRQLITSLEAELENAIVLNEQIIAALESVLYPSILKFEASVEATDDFYSLLIEAVKETKSAILNTSLDNLINTYVDSVGSCYDSYYLELLLTEPAYFKESLLAFNTNLKTYLPEKFVDDVKSLKEAVKVLNDISFMKEAKSIELTSIDVTNLSSELSTDTIRELVIAMADKFKQLEDGKTQITEEFKEAYITLKTEEQLLRDIKKLDKNREFFYSVPIESHLAIDFNESDSNLNTLMNPLSYYDINNINNTFVISKLDIDYLTKGIQIARSSRIN